MALEQELRQLIASGERTLPASGRRNACKEALIPQYRLLLNLLARPQPAPVAQVDDYLRVIRALREPESTARLHESVPSAAPAVLHLLNSPLRVLASRLARLKDTVVLILESGAERLTLCTIRGGRGPIETRITLATASDAFVAAAIALLETHRADVETIATAAELDEALYVRLRDAGAACWAALPDSARAALERSDSILYLPSPFGDLSELPIELCRSGDQWLGTSRSIARFPSLRHLLETLSPNRFPARLSARACVVCADSEEALEEMQRETDGVRAALERMKIAAEFDRQPTEDKLRQRLDAGCRVFHFVGHGSANPFGEFLPLGESGELRPADFSRFGGAQTPFAFLNVCEVGRQRTGAAGSAAGLATRLVEKGAPAVIACLQQVPDQVATAIAISFYEAAARQDCGRALSTARKAMDAVPYPPACWGAYVMYGDPLVSLSDPGSGVKQARDHTPGWGDLIARFLVTRAPADRDKALELLDAERRAAPPAIAGLLEQARTWLAAAFEAATGAPYSQHLALCDALAAHDVVAAGALRMLLSFECIEGRHPNADPAYEAAAGQMISAALTDQLAWPAFVFRSVSLAKGVRRAVGVKHLLEEAEGMLEAWALSEDAVKPLLQGIRGLLRGR